MALWAMGVAGAGRAEGYVVGAGDALHITVYDEPSLSGELVVTDGCTITLGLIGRVEVCGRSVSEIEAEVTERYAGGYLIEPAVAVKVVRYHSQRVDVLGEVAKPGPQYLEGPTSLIEVVSMAGGARADNVVNVEIVHPDGTVSEHDLTRMPMGEVVVVRAGDQIFLRPGQVVYVEGQIARPGAITLATGLTATQALALAGGPTATANLRAVLVNRADGSKVRLNVNRVHRGVAEDVVLGSDDHLIVPLNPF
jgi:polysaccharide export outer membrane protein